MKIIKLFFKSLLATLLVCLICSAFAGLMMAVIHLFGNIGLFVFAIFIITGIFMFVS